MRTFGKYVLIVIICGFTFGCEKEFDINKPDVEQFVILLKQGEYESPYLPYFSPKDIPHLLMYAKDSSEIDWFPINGLSSYMIQTFRLGECLLWVVETIRVTYPQPDPIHRYAGAIPKLMKISFYNDHEENSIVRVEDYWLDETEIFQTVELYAKWWNENKNKNFEDFRDIYPLAGSEFSWFSL